MTGQDSRSSKIAFISHRLISIVLMICVVQLISFGLIIQRSWQNYQQAQRLETLNGINHDLFEASDQLARENNLSQALLSGSRTITLRQRAQLITFRSQGDASMERALEQIDSHADTLPASVRDPLENSWRHFLGLRAETDRHLAAAIPLSYETLAFQLSLSIEDMQDRTNIAVHELTRKLGTAPDESIGRLAEASYLLWQVHDQVAADGSAMIVRAQMNHMLNSSDEAALEVGREFSDIVMGQLQIELRFLDQNALGYHASALSQEVDDFLNLSTRQIADLQQSKPSPFTPDDYRQQAERTQDHLMILFNRLSTYSNDRVAANSHESLTRFMRYSTMLILAIALNLLLLTWLRRRVLRPLKLLSTIQDAAREAILLVNASGSVFMANTGSEILFGLSARQLLTSGVETLLPEMQIGPIQLNKLAQSGEEIRGCARLSHGRQGHISMIASQLPIDRGPQGTLLIIRDDSARHQAEEDNRLNLAMLSEITRIQNLLFTQTSRLHVFSELLAYFLAATHADCGCLLEIRESEHQQTFRCRAYAGMERSGAARTLEHESEKGTEFALTPPSEPKALDWNDNDSVRALYEKLKDDAEWALFPVTLQNDLSGLMGVRRPHLDPLQKVLEPILGLYASVLGFVSEEESRKQSSAQLSEVLREQEALFSASPAGLIQIDQNARIVRTNHHACQIFGVEENGVQHLGLDQLLNAPKAWHILGQRIVRIRTGKQAAPCELECRSRAGSLVWVLFEIRALHTDHPQEGMILSCIDITELKATEQALREASDQAAEARGQLEAAIEAIPEAFAFYNEIDHLVVCNQHYANMFSANLTPQRMIGRSFEEGIRYSIEERGETIEGGFDTDGWVQERIRRHHAEENNFQLHIGDQWYLSSNHKIPGLGNVCLRANITELKNQELELRQAKIKADDANRAKSAFLASISHEIRTPLNGILGLLELLYLTPLEHGQQDTLLSVQESAQTLLRLIDDILDFSKIEAGKLELIPEPMSIPPLFSKIRDLYQEMASAKNLGFVLDIDPNLAPGHLADPLRLRQILQNFVSNALKFTERGAITLKLKVLANNEKQQTLRFSCIDSGIGIASESLSILFQPFTQAESSTTRRFGGTGLGLAICKRLAEQMGGEVALESKPGQGTTAILTVTLPRATPPQLESTPLASAEQTHQASTIGKNIAPILFVEDNPTNRKLTMMQLERIGVSYEVAENGQQAYDMWLQKPYSLVLTDCHMPIMDGHQLAQAIRRTEADAPGLQPVPIIACTANIGKDEADRAIAAGMNEVLTKPIGLDALRKMLNAWLGQASAIEPSAALPVESASAQVVDRATLEIYSQGDLSIELGILQDFLSTEVDDRDALKAAVASQNYKDARWSTHRIKGAGRMVGALPLANAAEYLETCAKQESSMTEALETLEMAFHEVENWVAQHQTAP